MKSRYKYIHFENVLKGHWYCYNNKTDDDLGCATYYEPWKQWVIDFTDAQDCVFNNQCLRDIADFLDQLNKTSISKPKGTK